MLSHKSKCIFEYIFLIVCHSAINVLSKANLPKHLGLQLDSKLSFDIHIKVIITKVNRTAGLLRNFQQVLGRPSLTAIYIAFDQDFNNSFNITLPWQ